MITVPELAAGALEKFLGSYMRRRFGSSQAHLAEIVPSAARSDLECIGNSDALQSGAHAPRDACGPRYTPRSYAVLRRDR